MDSTPFTELGVSNEIAKSLRRMKFTTPTPVQKLTIAPFLSGEDLLVQAPTGTGKTAAFGLPIIQKLDSRARTTQALILCPTRELALQITSVLRELSVHKQGVRIASIYGGEKINRQIAFLQTTPQIIVATPGRLMDHMQRKTVKLTDIRTVVLDEADRMLDMGFRRDIERILRAVPRERQTVLFSATIPQEIYLIAGEYQNGAREIRVEQESLAVESVRQFYTAVHPGGKSDALVSLLKNNDFPLTLVFVNTKYRADRVAEQLCRRGFKAAALHGNMRQSARDRVMRQYRLGELQTLVATDVAARGIDVKNIDAVINYDAPMDDESYVHRIGRTGRAEQEGLAYTFIHQDEADRLRKMIRHLKIEMTPTQDTLELPETQDEKSYGKVSAQSFHSINHGRGRQGRRMSMRPRGR